MLTSDPDPARLLVWLGSLNDLARLRMLRLLVREELSVGELARALQLPQSTVSRHLKLLHEAAWLQKRTVGTATFYRMEDGSLDPQAHALWEASRVGIESSPTLEEDDTRLASVMAERAHDSKTYFGRIGGEWDQIRNTLFGRGFTAEALLSFLQRDWDVADLGCGTGNAAEHLAPHVRRVIAIDREPAMLDAARKRLASFNNVEFREGDLTRLPLKADELDAAMLFLVMHHMDNPAGVVAESARVLKHGGLLMIVDMVAHDRDEYRHEMGHRHLGFSEQDIHSWARRAGMTEVVYRRLRPDSEGKGPGLFVATMRKA